MKEYSDAVAFYAEHKIDNVFFNEGDEHALIVFENIFKEANSSIIISAQNLCNDVTKNTKYLTSLESFLSKENTTLDIIVTEYQPNNAHPFFNCITKYRNKVRLKSTNGSSLFKLNIDDKETIVNFCVADGQMYRLETDIIKRKAICNFKDKKNCAMLMKSFNEIFLDNKYNDIRL